MRFTGDRLCKQRLTGSGRSHQQRALGKLRADLGISSRIMQEIHDLLQGFLGLVLTCHVLKRDAGFLLYINLGVALSHTHGASAAGHLLHQEIEEDDDRHKRQHIGQEDRQKQAGIVRNLSVNLNAVVLQILGQRIVLHQSRIVSDFRLLQEGIVAVVRFRNDGDLRISDLHSFHASLFHHLQKLIVGDFLAGHAAEHPHEKAHADQRYQSGHQNHHQILSSRRPSSRASRPLRAAALAVIIVIIAASSVIAVQIVVVHS